MSNGTCSIEGCGKTRFCRGWCSKHYSRWQRHGDPLSISRSEPLAQGSTHKRCPRCEQSLPVERFDRRSSGALKGYCRECHDGYYSEYLTTEHGAERRRRASTGWSRRNREYFLQRNYGITLADYERLSLAQDGKCAICGTTDPGGRAECLVVDHCHDSGDVRGLLCCQCNLGLGSFGDDPERLRAAARYLDA